MDVREKLLNNASARQRPLRTGADRLGVSARTYLERKNSQFRENASVVDVWREALPDELYEHCGLVGISGGILRLEVDPGPYMHEMRLLKAEFLAHLQNSCRQTRIKKIVLHLRTARAKQQQEQQA
jgi:hypothetical protein